ncbi:MAG TPA: CARDB domain-containing protein, partial [Candidatus Limnocylindrales bacterium]|nr:CARDB domain-containing protein [Candidatus Limnocylindrales bacterium]
SYYLTRYKLGSFPAVKRDTIYVSHRNQPYGLMPSPLYSKIMKLRSGSSPARNKVEVMAFLTAPGTIKTVVGSKTYTVEAAAGVSTHLFDLSAGTVSATVSRNGAPVATVTSPHKVVTSTTQQNLLYNYVSSGREGFVYRNDEVVSGQPDLVVGSISQDPLVVKPGALTTFKAVVTNKGTAATPVGKIIGVSFSVDGAQVSWSDTYTSSLAPGASVTLTANGGPDGNATWTAIDGVHAVTAEVDDVNRIQNELSETNNLVAASLTVTAADTVAPTVSLTTPATGTNIGQGATVRLDASAADNVAVTKVEFYNGSTLLDTNTLAPWSYGWNTTGTTLGAKTLTAKAFDAAGNVTTSAPVIINVVTPQPDLVVTAISSNPAIPAAGNATTFSAVVQNIGTAPTPSGTIIGVSFWVDGVQVSWSDTNSTSLAPGASVTLTANYGPNKTATWKATKGTHTVQARVDDINRITNESNETNNNFDKTYVIK